MEKNDKFYIIKSNNNQSIALKNLIIDELF